MLRVLLVVLFAVGLGAGLHFYAPYQVSNHPNWSRAAIRADRQNNIAQPVRIYAVRANGKVWDKSAEYWFKLSLLTLILVIGFGILMRERGRCHTNLLFECSFSFQT